MLAHRQPPSTHVLCRFRLRTAALALSVATFALFAACFKDDGAGLTSEVTLTSSSSGSGSTGSSSSGDGPTTGTGSTGESSGGSTGALTPTTGSTGEDDTGTTTGTSGECVDIWYFDIDGDGFGGPEQKEGCGPPPPGFTVDSLDCDDTNKQIFPGADEVCDGADNDCDAGVDEWPANQMLATCNGCRASEHEGHYYYFCQTPESTWQDARARCQLLLGDLVVVEDNLENQFLYSTIKQQGKRWWIGLSDLALEGQFEWVDGTPLPPKTGSWFNGEPDNKATDMPGDADCVALISDLFLLNWRDQVCASANSFVCEAAGS
jgi:hypothetical protein